MVQNNLQVFLVASLWVDFTSWYLGWTNRVNEIKPVFQTRFMVRLTGELSSASQC